jgi:AcrR family transcriptional regulator
MTEQKQRKRIAMHPDQRRATILTAAARVMAEKGPARTAISDITDAAEIGKGTFYLYFPSKNHLLSAMWSSYVDKLIAQATMILKEAAPLGWQALTEALIERLVRFDLEHADLRRMIYEGAGPEALRMFSDGSFRLQELLKTVVRQGVAEGGYRSRYPDMSAELVYHAAYGVLRDRILYGPPLDVELLIKAVKELVSAFLQPTLAPVGPAVALAAPGPDGQAGPPLP